MPRTTTTAALPLPYARPAATPGPADCPSEGRAPSSLPCLWYWSATRGPSGLLRSLCHCPARGRIPAGTGGNRQSGASRLLWDRRLCQAPAAPRGSAGRRGRDRHRDRDLPRHRCPDRPSDPSAVRYFLALATLALGIICTNIYFEADFITGGTLGVPGCRTCHRRFRLRHPGEVLLSRLARRVRRPSSPCTT